MHQALGIRWWDIGDSLTFRCWKDLYKGVCKGDILVFWGGIFLYINLSDFPSPHYQSVPALNRKEQSGKSHLLPWQGVTQQNQQTKSSISESESQQPIHSLPLPPTTRKSRLCVDWWPRREGKEAERPTSPERQGYPAAQLIEQRFGHLGHK